MSKSKQKTKVKPAPAARKRGNMPSDQERIRGDAALDETINAKTAKTATPKTSDVASKSQDKKVDCANGLHDVEIDPASGLRVCVKCRAVVIPKEPAA